jgi:hypothetical protein
MNRRKMGIFAGIAAAALTTWWYRHRRHGSSMTQPEEVEVIYSNRPLA